MTKRVNTVFSIIILFCSVLIFPLKALAANVSITGNGAADATVTTSGGENVTNNNDLNRYENYKVSYHWTLAPGSKVNDGDTASFTLPNNVQVLNDTTFDVTLDDGTVIGQFNIKEGEKVGTLTFNDYLSQHPMTNVSGHLSFWGNGTQNQSTEMPEINKVGWVNDQGKPTWSVLYNPKGEERDNVIIEDTLEGKQTLDKDSIKIEYGTMQNGVFVADSQQPEGTTLDTNEKGFKLSIPKLDKTVRITYTSTPENTQFDLDNKVVATSDQLTMVQNDASITVGGSGDVTGTTESTTTSSSSESTESTTTPSSSESMESTTTPSGSESTESTTTPSGSESTESTTTTGGSQRKQQPSVVVMTDNNHSSNQRPGAGAPANATTLPQTGNKENHILMIVGLVMLVIFSILSITLYYRHRMMK